MAMNMKRRKTELEDLSDETLMQILLRAPVKSVHQCKLVSKRWLALISSPYFYDCHRLQYNASLRQGKHHLQLVNYRSISLPFDPFILIDNDSCNSFTPTTRTIEVQALPKSQTLISLDLFNQQWPMNIISCVSNDLVLTVSDFGLYTPSLYLNVSNPLTKQSYRLPKPPPCLSYNPITDAKGITDINGIVCSVDDPALYKVVLVKDTPRLVRRGVNLVRCSEFLKFYVFSSHTCSWCKFIVHPPEDFVSVRMVDKEIGQYTTTLDGALYWCTNMIMVYNPFDKENPQHCDFIDLPEEAKLDEMYNERVSPVDQRRLCIANVEQHLRLYHWSYVTASTQTLTVWDMKDYTNGHDRTWNIKHFVDLTSINWLCNNVCMSIKGFDPYDGDVLYVFSKELCLLSVNLRSKNVQLLADFKSNVSTSLPWFRLFHYCPPFCPTPVTKSMAATAIPTPGLL